VARGAGRAAPTLGLSRGADAVVVLTEGAPSPSSTWPAIAALMAAAGLAFDAPRHQPMQRRLARLGAPGLEGG